MRMLPRPGSCSGTGGGAVVLITVPLTRTVWIFVSLRLMPWSCLAGFHVHGHGGGDVGDTGIVSGSVVFLLGRRSAVDAVVPIDHERAQRAAVDGAEVILARLNSGDPVLAKVVAIAAIVLLELFAAAGVGRSE